MQEGAMGAEKVMQADTNVAVKWQSICIGGVVIGLLFLISTYNYLLFHSISELFSIVVAGGIFMIAWNTRKHITNGYILVIGVAYLFIAFLDLIHTLSYKGMGVFQGYGANLPTQLWIAARYMEALTLFAAIVMIKRKVRPELVFCTYLLITATLLAAVLYWPVFPDCYIDGVGLTPFKIYSEYVISLLLCISLLMLWKNRQMFLPSVFRLLVVSILLTICAELAFTFYVSVYGLSNLVGHLFKIISFYLIYLAIIQTGLRQPHELMYRELSMKEDRYRQMFYTNQAIKLIINPLDGAIVEANNAACAFYGYSQDRITQLKISDINMVPPDRVAEDMHQAKVQSKMRFTFPHRLASGEVRLVEVFSGPLRYGEHTYLYSIITDVTERESAIEKLRESEEKFRIISKAAQDGIIMMNEEGKVTFWNKAAEKLFQYKETEVLDKLLHPLITTSEDNASFNHNFERFIRSGKGNAIGQTIAVTGVRRNGDHFPVELSLSAVKRKDAWHSIGIVRDVSERVRSENEKKILETKLNHTKKMEAIGQLAGGIAHDFNNILYPIIGFTELSQNELPDNHPVQDNLSDIKAGALRAKDLVKRILHISRQQEPELKPTILRPVVEESYKFLRSTIPSNIDFQLNMYDGQNGVLCDGSEIHEIIINLCTNAYHAIAEDSGRIVICLNRTDPPPALNLPDQDYLCLSVKDTGSGIADEIKERIFEPYVTTKDVGRGSGLGLSVVYGIVQNYNGGIHVDSSPGKGTTFEIYLPITTQVAFIEVPRSTDDMKSDRSEQILFVDDEESIVKLCVKALEKFGYQTTGITDSTEAFHLFESDPDRFDLVITDMAMPGIVGSELARRILEIRPDMPVMICSGYSERLEKIKAKELKISLFLDKPLTIESLVESTKHVLDGHKAKLRA